VINLSKCGSNSSGGCFFHTIFERQGKKSLRAWLKLHCLFLQENRSGYRDEVRDAGIIQANGAKCLIVGRNNASVLLFEKRKK
jgi:hypothetical protein